MKKNFSTIEYSLLSTVKSWPGLLLLLLLVLFLMFGILKDKRQRDISDINLGQTNQNSEFPLPLATRILKPKLVVDTAVSSGRNSERFQNLINEKKIISYTIVDSMMKGNSICVCPISKTIFIHREGCEDKCPHCHKKLLNAVYAGSDPTNLANK
ncbi:MAG: hypothetical protein HQK51_12100 [Oligoflexia bacterium]|nr:hypothetical protein [Oligoflexia bacterium]